MTKFTGKDMTLTISATAITCINSVDTGDASDVIDIECAGQDYKERIVGQSVSSLAVSGAVDITAGGANLEIWRSLSGDLNFQPAGAASGAPNLKTSAAIVNNMTTSTPVNGFMAYSLDIVTENPVWDDLP